MPQKKLHQRRVSWSRHVGRGQEMEMIESMLSAWWVWAVPVAFVAVLVYAFNPKRKKQFEEEARVPLEDDPPIK
jgi:cbb3-type cytochrome oxidase subunit 3